MTDNPFTATQECIQRLRRLTEEFEGPYVGIRETFGDVKAAILEYLRTYYGPVETQIHDLQARSRDESLLGLTATIPLPKSGKQQQILVDFNEDPVIELMYQIQEDRTIFSSVNEGLPPCNARWFTARCQKLDYRDPNFFDDLDAAILNFRNCNALGEFIKS